MPTRTVAQGLDLGLEEAGKVVSAESLFPHAQLTLTLFSVYVVIGIALIIFMFFKKKKDWTPAVVLENFPSSAKAAITLGMIAYVLVHIFALLEVYLMTTVSFQSTSEYFHYMKLQKLAATSHAHFFGHGTMYLITSLIFVFSRLKESWKITLIALALSAGLLDVPSWWAIKYGGGQYEIFSAIAGMMSLIGWGIMTFRIFYELWAGEFLGKKR